MPLLGGNSVHLRGNGGVLSMKAQGTHPKDTSYSLTHLSLFPRVSQAEKLITWVLCNPLPLTDLLTRIPSWTEPYTFNPTRHKDKFQSIWLVLSSPGQTCVFTWWKPKFAPFPPFWSNANFCTKLSKKAESKLWTKGKRSISTLGYHSHSESCCIHIIATTVTLRLPAINEKDKTLPCLFSLKRDHFWLSYRRFDFSRCRKHAFWFLTQTPPGREKNSYFILHSSACSLFQVFRFIKNVFTLDVNSQNGTQSVLNRGPNESRAIFK